MITDSLLHKFSVYCGDWASFDRETGLYYCGWMSPHNDIGCGVTRKNRNFNIGVDFCVPNGRLVHRHNGKIIASELEVGEWFTFDAAYTHSFLPVELAEQCVKTQSHKASRQLFKLRNSSTQDTKVRLIWRFL